MRMTDVFVGALAILVSASQVAAQTQTRSTSAFEVGAGPVVGQGSGLGIHLSGAYVTPPTRFGLAIRLDGTFNTWRARSHAAPTLGGNRVSSLGVSLVQTLWPGAFQPYATVGFAAYAERRSGLSMGPSAGGGFRLRLGRTSLFTELRVHRIGVENETRVTPLTFGIRF
jgi:hypothetical protein